MSFWCPVSVWDMGTHPKVGHVSSSTSSQTTVGMVCDQFWELWLSSSCCRIASAQTNFPSQLHWSGCFEYVALSMSMWLWSQLLSHASWGITRIHQTCVHLLCRIQCLDLHPSFFLQRLWILWIFQRFRFVFHKVRKAVARVVVHKGD